MVTKIKLFVFPYAGGSARVYQGWKKYLPPQVELIPIEARGRGRRFGEPLVNSMEEMVEDVFQQVKDQILDSPYALFGHSMGAVISHELCYKIREAGLPEPIHLFISGREAPHLMDEDEEKTHLLPEDELKEKLKTMGGTPPEVLENPELLNIFLPIIRADFKICETYFHKRREDRLSYEITMMYGMEEDLSEEQALGWQEYTSGELTVRRFPGDHFFIFANAVNIVRIICQTIFTLVDESRNNFTIA